METDRHQYDQNELASGCMNAQNKHQVALLGNNMNMHDQNDYKFGTCNVFDM